MTTKPEYMPIFIGGAGDTSVVVWPDGSMHRADVLLDIAIKLRNHKQAADILGMTVEEFRRILKTERERLSRLERGRS